jgi:hypothetical protein
MYGCPVGGTLKQHRMRQAAADRGGSEAGAVSQEDAMSNAIALDASNLRPATDSLSVSSLPKGDNFRGTAELVTRTVSAGASAAGRQCPHQPPCPPADAVDREAARLVVSRSEQGWSLRCNGVITFDDTGELLPDRRAVAPRRGPAPHRSH